MLNTESFTQLKNKLFTLRIAVLYLLITLSFLNVVKAEDDTSQIPEDIKSQIPEPPEGFEWKLYKNAFFPKPLQWNELESSTNGKGIPMTVYATSPEKFSNTKYFEMGFTIQIISGPKKSHKVEASKVAILYLKPFVETHKKEEILMFEESTVGDFETMIFRYRDAPAGLIPIIVHKFILANNITDSVHVFTYESPESTWAENWTRYGEPILSKVNIITTLPSK